MKLSNLLAGLTILRAYWDDPDGFRFGCEHDQFYAYATNRPLSTEDVARMRELEWFQEDVESDGDDEHGEYDPEESWSAYT